MTIARATLRSNVFKDPYDVVNTNVSDPLSRDKQWVFSSLPNFNAPKFVGFPLIIVKTLVGKSYPTFDNAYSDVNAQLEIWVYSSKRSQMKTVADTVDTYITPTNLPQFTFFDYDEDEGDVKVHGQNVHWRRMTHFVRVNNIG